MAMCQNHQCAPCL